MDLAKYKELKAKGLVTLEKVGATKVFAISKRWDSTTGDELPSITDELSEDHIKNLIDQANQMIAQQTAIKTNYNLLLTDMETTLRAPTGS